MPNLSEKIQGLTGTRTEIIDKIIADMETRVTVAQLALFKTVIDDYIAKLDIDEEGRIKNTVANKQRLQLLDGVYTRWVNVQGVQLVNAVVASVQKTLDFNEKYFATFTAAGKLAPIMTEVKNIVADWLGITNRGGLVENGYLNTLLRDQTIKNTIKDSTFKSIISGKGFFEVKKDLADFIEGNKTKTGALQQYYRNYVYDTFSQVDRTQAKIIGDKLGVNKFAIYEGGLIKTSRQFCKERNGKVFTYAEIEQFNPPTAKQPNYNPFTDLGGYACRHHLNWVPQAVAYTLRPDLKPAA
jgi:hypothetical protein